jgi:toxin ParE1/3/4
VSRFKERVAEGLSATAANPERYPPVRDMPGVQKFRLTQFPFSLLYINRADYLWVVADAHESRKPGYWKKRVV